MPGAAARARECARARTDAREPARLTPSPATAPQVNPHVVIVESTYGVASHRPREERENRFLQTVRDIIEPGGRCLLPVVALGRAQELLLMLDEHWEQHPEIRHIPIYQASGLAQRAMTVYQTYIEFMNDAIRSAFQIANPFVFNHVQHLRGPLDDTGACVVLATPSMLQSGLSRELFESWCENPKNGCIIADFAVQGTLAREILTEPNTITSKQGLRIPLRCKVEAISFSAHADFPQTREFLDMTAPPHVVLVHGEMVEMGRLKRALEQKAAADGRQRIVHMPKNCETVRMELAVEKRAKVVGRLAEEKVADGTGLQGMLVRRGFTDMIVDPSDLGALTQLHTSKIVQRQALPVTRPLAALRLDLEMLIHDVREVGEEEARAAAVGIRKAERGPAAGAGGIVVGERVRVSYMYGGPDGGAAAKPEARESDTVILEWESSPASDLLADAIVAVILNGEPESEDMVEAEARREAARKDGDLEKVRQMEMVIAEQLLLAQFGNCDRDADGGSFGVEVDGVAARLLWDDAKIDCDDGPLKDRLALVVGRIKRALQPVCLVADG